MEKLDMDLQNQVHVSPKDAAALLLNNGSLPDPLVLNPAPKVRKPYTISKQREKWSDEEHQKFLDALKLYGRAWRLIQEFIGTKTAVQIRSHAQKFFSKVVQGGNDNTESSVPDIDIPPPRPKRKPAHPYPRKYVDPLTVIVSPSFQIEKRICSNSANADSENQSPNSVLSAALTQASEFPTSELPDSCLSNSSCSTGTLSGNLFYGNGEDNSMAINTSPSSAGDNSANLCAGLCDKESDLQEVTIMLFGQIVSTKDSKLPSTDVNSSITPSEQQLAVNTDNKYEKPEESPASNDLDAQLSHGMYQINWRPWSWNGMNKCTSSMQWMPIPLYTGLPPQYLMSYDQTTASSFMEERTLGNELFSSSLNNDSTEETKDKAYASIPKPIHKSGFVPYKRCSASSAGPIDSAKIDAEEDGHRVQLCL